MALKIFGPLYDRTIRWAKHPHATTLLVILSFAEAIIFPVPPEVMIAPMALADRARAIWFATLSLIGSIAGAVVGYLLGHFAFEAAQPIIQWLGWGDAINAQVVELREMVAQSPWKAFWLLVAAGFVPIPMKIFTWAAGIVGMPMLPFLAGMLVGRGKRVYLVAIAIKLGGARGEAMLRRWIEPLGWIAMAALAIGITWLIWRAKFG